MAREIKIFPDGRVFEMQEENSIKVRETHGQVELLIEALQFSQTNNFTLAPFDAIPPDVAEPRAPQRKINQEGLNLIKKFEGLHELKQGSDGVYVEAYLDPVNVWTIGWGCTEGIHQGMKITVVQAEEMLRKELSKFEAAVADAVQVQINDNQFSALVCFSYNVGARALFESTLLKLLNQGKFQEAADQFLRWDKAGGQVFLGLSRRRRAERALFLSQHWEEFVDWFPNRVLQLANPGEPIMQGDDVRQLQKALIKVGFKLPDGADGIFGKGTDKAVRDFQQQKGLTVDGQAGPQTLKALGL